MVFNIIKNFSKLSLNAAYTSKFHSRAISLVESESITTSTEKVLVPLKPKILRYNSLPKFVAPVSESVQPKVLSPFPTHVQAWLLDFKTSEPKDILNISADVFAAPLRRDLLHRAVIYERDGLRQGTHSALSRSEVSGTGKKAYSQKGRGKARVGSLRAPQFRGGGRAFPVKPRDHSTQLQRKVFNHALRVVLSTKYAQNQLILIDSVDLDSHKTRDLNQILVNNQWNSTMFMVGEPSDYLELAIKNISNASIGDIYDPKIYQMMLHSNLILDKLSLAYFEDTLSLD